MSSEREFLLRCKRAAAVAGLFAVACMGPAIPLEAATATPYGQEFVRLGREWHDGLPAGGRGQGATEAALAEVSYKRLVTESEIHGGPYADALAEPLAALARHRRGQGDLERAERLYRRALHVVRVNDGLYSKRQIPILRELLDTYRAAGDLTTLDERYEYFFRLYGRGEPPYSDVRMRAALEYLRWQREAVRRDLDGKDNRRLLDLYELNDELLQAVAADTAADPQWYRQLCMSQLRNLYLIQDRVQPKLQNSSAPPSVPIFASDWGEKDSKLMRLEGIQRGAVGQGVRLLEDLLARDDGASVEERARLHLELADWYQWNGSEHRAAEHYGAVVQQLDRAGQHGTMEDWLGKPVELPDNGAFWQPATVGEGERRVIVAARYDVTSRGRAKNIHIHVKQEEDEGVAVTLRRQLARTRFRPRYTDGQAADYAALAREYVLID